MADAGQCSLSLGKTLGASHGVAHQRAARVRFTAGRAPAAHCTEAAAVPPSFCLHADNTCAKSGGGSTTCSVSRYRGVMRRPVAANAGGEGVAANNLADDSVKGRTFPKFVAIRQPFLNGHVSFSGGPGNTDSTYSMNGAASGVVNGEDSGSVDIAEQDKDVNGVAVSETESPSYHHLLQSWPNGRAVLKPESGDGGDADRSEGSAGHGDSTYLEPGSSDRQQGVNIASSSGFGSDFGVRRGLRGAKSQKDAQFVARLLEFLRASGIPPDPVPTARKLEKIGRKDLADGVRTRGIRMVRQLLLKATRADTPTSSDVRAQSSDTHSDRAPASNKPSSNGAVFKNDQDGIGSTAAFLEEQEKRRRQLELIQQKAALFLESGKLQIDESESKLMELEPADTESVESKSPLLGNSSKASDFWSVGIDALARQKAALLKASLLRRTSGLDLMSLSASIASKKKKAEMISELARSSELDQDSESTATVPERASTSPEVDTYTSESKVEPAGNSETSIKASNMDAPATNGVMDLGTKANEVGTEASNSMLRTDKSSLIDGSAVRETEGVSALATPPVQSSLELEHPPDALEFEFIDYSKPGQPRSLSRTKSVVETEKPNERPRESLVEAAKRFRQSAAFSTFKVFTPIPMPPPQGFVPGMTSPLAAATNLHLATTSVEAVEDKEATILQLRKENEELFHDIRLKQQELEAISMRESRLQEEFKRVTQTELLRIKGALEAREAELASMVKELEEAKGQFADMRAKAMTELNQMQQVLAEKDVCLQRAEGALAKMILVKMEYWGGGNQIQLAGSFNGWTQYMDMQPDLTSAIPQEDGSNGPLMWEVELYLYPGMYQVKFVIDGVWTVDPRRDVVAGDVGQNNLLVVEP